MAPGARRESAYILPPPPPINVSLTSGTNIPAPPDSPPRSPDIDLSDLAASNVRLSRPPTSGGGPLSSHPTNNSTMHIPGAFPPTPDAESHHGVKLSTDTTNTAQHTADSIQSPTSPTADPNMQSSPSQRRPQGVRRLFSLTSLRQSFSSSRTSLSIRPDTSRGSYQPSIRPQSPGMMSTTASIAAAPSMHSANPATLRKKRSSNWFKRKSGFFGTNDGLDVLTEDGPEHKRFKPANLPMLPEISALRGGELDGGNLGWDDQLFKSSNGF